METEWSGEQLEVQKEEMVESIEGEGACGRLQALETSFVDPDEDAQELAAEALGGVKGLGFRLKSCKC